MAIYLVDFENVHSEGLKGIDHLEETDKVYLFYSPNADSITFETHFKLIRSKANIEMFEAKRTGKNAIDFHLSTFLGYLLATDAEETFFVVSKDNGFQYAFDFWRSYSKSQKPKLFYAYSIERGLNLLRKSELEQEPQSELEPVQPDDQEPSAPEQECTLQACEPEPVESQEQKIPDEQKSENNDPRREAIRAKLDEDLNDGELDKLICYLDNCKTLQDLYRSIIREFGQSRGLVVYRAVKKR